MSKLILAAALAVSLAACSKPAPPPVDATPAAGGQAPSAQDGGPVQQK